MVQSTSGLQDAAQYLALFVYIAVSAFGLVVAWVKRDAFQNLNSVKPASGDADLVEASELPASFSRTVGLAGAVALGAFMWCIGLLLLVGHPLLGSEGFSKSLQEYILAASALFAPYAFNQLTQIFPNVGKTGTTSLATDAIRADLKVPVPPLGA